VVNRKGSSAVFSSSGLRRRFLLRRRLLAPLRLRLRRGFGCRFSRCPACSEGRGPWIGFCRKVTLRAGFLDFLARRRADLVARIVRACFSSPSPRIFKPAPFPRRNFAARKHLLVHDRASLKELVGQIHDRVILVEGSVVKTRFGKRRIRGIWRLRSRAGCCAGARLLAFVAFASVLPWPELFRRSRAASPGVLTRPRSHVVGDES